jgi:hypothetical protein
MIMYIMNYSHDEPGWESVRWFEGNLGAKKPPHARVRWSERRDGTKLAKISWTPGRGDADLAQQEAGACRDRSWITAVWRDLSPAGGEQSTAIERFEMTQ